MLTGNKVNVSRSSSVHVHGPRPGYAFPNPRLGQGGFKQLESGAWKAGHPFKDEKGKGILSRDKEKSWRKGGSLRICPHLLKFKGDVTPPRKKSALTWQPFPKCTYVSCLNLETVCSTFKAITNCFTEILTSLDPQNSKQEKHSTTL